MKESITESLSEPCGGCDAPNWRLRRLVGGSVAIALLAIGWLAASGAKTASAAPACKEIDHSHEAWSAVLRTNVEDGWVDYKNLSRSGRASLDAYLNALSGPCAQNVASWTEKQRLAYWINAYNAFTIALVLEHYPLASIRKIGLLPGAAFREEFIPIHSTGEQKISLNDIEHEILRKQFNEPRIHFALVCAAKSCPILRSEAFRAADLDKQLTEQTRAFLADRSKNRIDAKRGTLRVSKIFDWFSGDFEKGAGSVTKFISGYIDAQSARALSGSEPAIEYLDYDWSLNGS